MRFIFIEDIIQSFLPKESLCAFYVYEYIKSFSESKDYVTVSLQICNLFISLIDLFEAHSLQENGKLNR